MTKKLLIIGSITLVMLGLFIFGLQRRQFDGFSGEKVDKTHFLGLKR